MTQAKALAVVMPARDEAAILRDTLPALLQALAPLEFSTRIFLVDDGSTDDTAAVARAHGVRVIAGAGRGPGAARNQGAHEALSWLAEIEAEPQGWLLFLDADCRVAPDHFTRMVPHLNAPGTALISVQERPDLPQGILRLGNRFKRAFQRFSAERWGIPIVHAGCLYLRAPQFRSLGGFNHEHLFEDIELGFRFAPEQLRVLAEPAVVEVSDRRLHRVGHLASWVVPARCAGVMFLASQVADSRLASFFLAAFLRLGEDRLPAQLWWSDPHGRLRVSLGAALRVTGLWLMVLASLRTGALRRQSRPLGATTARDPAMDPVMDARAG